MGGPVIGQYLMRFGGAGLAGIDFVSSLVVEDSRARGPAAGGQSLSQQRQEAIALLECIRIIHSSEPAIASPIRLLLTARIRSHRKAGKWWTDSALACLEPRHLPTIGPGQVA